MSACKCSMAISMLGDGCRYCQPQEYIDRLSEMLDDERAETRDEAKAQAQEPVPVTLTVWYGAMPESNGKTNWTAILHRKGACISEGITVCRSEYPDRVRYEADRMRFLIGELQEEPFILDYDADKHSGYVAPAPGDAQ